MIVDTSALVAILLGEAEEVTLSKKLDSATTVSISAGTLLEFSIVIDRYRNPALSVQVEELVERFNVLVEPVTTEQTRIARQAYRDYGKGSGHRANLNFGDCFAYALARVKREPLLFKGDDFVHTDLRPA
jgi:ribonuclease VapC